MKELNTDKIALIVGTFVGLIHFVWVMMIASGYGQVWLNFIFYLHFLNNPYTVVSFDLVRAVMLVVVTFTVGYISGWVFAYIWNRLHKDK